MPNIENLNQKPFTKESRSGFLQVRREDIIHREDLKTGFFYALTGLTISLAVAGTLYVVGKKLLA
jgi:hypothetical protein